MPGGDKTGPLGRGPLTGRNMGFCTREDKSGKMFNERNNNRRRLGLGRSFRRGNGQGRCMGYGNFHKENIPGVSEKQN